MKKHILFAGILMSFSMCSIAHASYTSETTLTATTTGSETIYSYTPAAHSDFYDLDHTKYYKWGISTGTDLGIDLSKVTIADVSITFTNIRNYDNNAYILWVELLDTAHAGITSGTDNQNTSNAFGPDNSTRTLLTEYTYDGHGGAHEIPKWSESPIDVTYHFTTVQIGKLISYAGNDGIIGLGFDPDCHFYNDGVTFNITTADIETPPSGNNPVPEPATMLLFGTGLAGLVGARLRRKKSN